MNHEFEYRRELLKICSAAPMDSFPQIEAADLLYKRISLFDFYLPVRLCEAGIDENGDTDAIIRKIDWIIAKLKAGEAAKRLLDKSENPGDARAREPDLHDDKLIYDKIFDDFSQQGLDREKLENSQKAAGVRLSIIGNPGAGKSIFCKRLSIALMDDSDGKNAFFDEYPKIAFNKNALPLYLAGSKYDAAAGKALDDLDFWQVAYLLSLVNADITFEEFKAVCKGAAEESRLLIILDGWDEILDGDFADKLTEKLNSVLDAYPETDFVLTRRPQYNPPWLTDSTLIKYEIPPLSNEDIRAFCEKWCRVIFDGQPEKQAWYDSLADQIISNSELTEMRQRPFSLALLLTLSKNDGSMPENFCELMSELVDLYVYWGVKKHRGKLTASSIKAYLKYLAWYFSNGKIFHESTKNVIKVIVQATADLEWTLQDDISSISPEQILLEVSRCGIFAANIDRVEYSFASINETGSSSLQRHRQFQEYLTADAIISMCCDSETNNKEPEDVFESHFEDSEWLEPIVFAVSMPYSGRLCGNIIKKLLDNVKKANDVNDRYSCTNLLFRILSSGVKVPVEKKREIYDQLFTLHVTDDQLRKIFDLVYLNNRTAADFEAYIDGKFRASVESGNHNFGYAAGAVECAKASRAGISPFARAEELLTNPLSDAADIAKAREMLTVLAWGRYSRIIELEMYIPKEMGFGYRISNSLKDRLKELVMNKSDPREQMFWAYCIKELIAAGTATFGDMFPDIDTECCSEVMLAGCSGLYEMILSTAPPFSARVSCSDDVRAIYRERLADEIKAKNPESIYTFNICAATGCFVARTIKKAWDDVSAVIREDCDPGSITLALWKNAKHELLSANLVYVYPLPSNTPYKVINLFLSSDRWHLLWTKTSSEKPVIYQNEHERIILNLTESASQLAKDFIEGSDILFDVTARNNLAYLIRRKEIECELVSAGRNFALTPQFLLEEGVERFDFFSFINYALAIAGIRGNEVGDLDMATEYVMNNAQYVGKTILWHSTVSWWLDLAVNSRETEGLIVLMWMFKLSVFDLNKLRDGEADALLELYRASSDVFSGTEGAFIAALVERARIKRDELSRFI